MSAWQYFKAEAQVNCVSMRRESNNITADNLANWAIIYGLLYILIVKKVRLVWFANINCKFPEFRPFHRK
jgi:hypothetical protein